jgi:hypothetical protein
VLALWINIERAAAPQTAAGKQRPHSAPTFCTSLLFNILFIMLQLLLTALVLVLAIYSVAQYSSLQRNIRSARESGLKYVISP